MQILRTSQQKKRKEYNLNLNEFQGTATVLDDAITGAQFAKEALNLIQEQDGRWATRWGRGYWGQALAGESSILGASMFVKSDGTKEIVAIGSSGKAYKSTDGGSWTEITGATFNASAKNYFFKQINNFLFICNGVDYMTRYNGSVLSRYVQLSAPTGLAGTRGSGLSAGGSNNFYKITALNDIGETVGSSEVNITTNKARIAWNPTNNEYIDLTWTAVSGAASYQIYYSELSGKQELLGSSTANSFRDDNSSTPNTFVVVPEQDSTGGYKFSMIATSGSRIWGIAPAQYKWRVFASGTGQYLGFFGYLFGGGWVDLDAGSDEEVAFIEHFKTGKGDTAATIFTKNPKGGGSVWQVTISYQEFFDETILVPNPEKIVGAVGTTSAGTAILTGDEILFLSKSGVTSLASKENVANVLSTTETSREIQPSYLGLAFSRSEQFRAYRFKNFIFFSATEGAGENDLIFLYDVDLKRWYWNWNFGVRQFLEYTLSNGQNVFLMVPTSGNQLVECGSQYSSDFGAPIRTSLLTGLIPVDEDKYAFAKVLEVFIDLGRPKGKIKMEVLGMEKRKGFMTLASREIDADTKVGAEFWSGDLGEITLKSEEDAPLSFASSSLRKRKKVGKVVNAIQFRIYSEDSDTRYTLLSLQAKGVFVDVRPPAAWN